MILLRGIVAPAAAVAAEAIPHVHAARAGVMVTVRLLRILGWRSRDRAARERLRELARVAAIGLHHQAQRAAARLDHAALLAEDLREARGVGCLATVHRDHDGVLRDAELLQATRRQRDDHGA